MLTKKNTLCNVGKIKYIYKVNISQWTYVAGQPDPTLCWLIAGTKYTCSFFPSCPGMETCSMSLGCSWTTQFVEATSWVTTRDCNSWLWQGWSIPSTECWPRGTPHCLHVPDPRTLEKAAQSPKAVRPAGFCYHPCNSARPYIQPLCSLPSQADSGVLLSNQLWTDFHAGSTQQCSRPACSF